ncbi:MAG TPA: Rid family detoxifying hydrolase [Solirubrobacteraceae bacterium]|nr:Rid family detoxifying hydrolase [Solirubrobacteraceae bacterium]
MSRRATITAAGAPAAVGPYSHAVRSGELIFCSGQLPIDPASGQIAGAGAGAQTQRCLENLQAVAEAAGSELARALRLTVYTTALEQFAQINEAYAKFFAAEPPARVTVGVAALPLGALVEIDAILPA